MLLTAVQTWFSDCQPYTTYCKPKTGKPGKCVPQGTPC